MKIETIYDYSILKVDWLSFDCPWLKWFTFRWCQQETGREKTEAWKTKWKSAIRLSDTYTSRIHQKWCQIQKKNGKKNWSNVLTTQSTWSDLQGKQRNLSSSILVNPVFLLRKTCQINASITKENKQKNGILRYFLSFSDLVIIWWNVGLRYKEPLHLRTIPVWKALWFVNSIQTIIFQEKITKSIWRHVQKILPRKKPSILCIQKTSKYPGFRT